ncbi:hypothetical protein G314FT_17360 [Vagococcus luciliae]|uniref:Tape measure protein N-terminal domain-containing protein n=1 Tax=Vagococcus luciliae TaxID=2920380 RepID=A0ABY5P0Z4_9ENTE|nr:tape measure protein [Vagococcus luciliae]UUV99575.1 hypothetical protein G314FT_17360 [Vagococcus luciliae]
MESYTVEAILSATDKGFTKAMKDANNSLGGLDDNSKKASVSIGDIMKGVGVFKLVDGAVNMVTSSLGSAIDRVDTLNNSQRVFENMGFSAKETSNTMDALKASIDGLPTPLDSAIKGVQLIASSTNDLSKSEEIFSALNNGILGFGGSATMVDNAVMQLSQSFSNGKVDAQTWNSMINSGLGPALNTLAKQMGVTTGELKEGLSSGKISVSEFQDALIDLNKNGGGGLKSLEQIAGDSTSGIKTGIANAKTAVVRGVADMITNINEGLKNTDFKSIGNIISQFGATFENVLKRISTYIPPIIQLVGNMFKFVGDNANWLMPIIAGLVSSFLAMNAINKTISIINNFKSAISGLTTVFSLLTSPIGLIGLAIGAVVVAGVLLYKNWETIQKIAQKVWESIKSTISVAVDVIVNVWDKMKETLSNLWNGVVEKASEVWDSVTTVIMGILNPFIEIFMNLWNGLSSSLAQVWDGIKSLASGAWELIKAVIMGPVLIAIDLITGDFTNLGSDLKMIWNSIKQGASDIWNGIKDIVTGLVKAIVEYVKFSFEWQKEIISNVWNYIKELASDVWNNIKNTVSDLADKAVNGLKNAWNKGLQWTKDIFNNIKNAIKAIGDVDLFAAGKAVIDSFIDGLKQTWEAGKKFVGGIADWIREHKGPIQYDRKLLIDNGKAIMDGLNAGLNTGFGKVQDNIGDMTKYFANTAFSQDFEIGANFSDLDKKINSMNDMNLSSNNELTLKNNAQPAEIKLSMGGRVFSAFVEDIGAVMQAETDLNLQT